MERAIIDDPRGCMMADYRDAWRKGRVAWLLETSPRALDRLAAVDLVVDAAGPTSAVVRVVRT